MKSRRKRRVLGVLRRAAPLGLALALASCRGRPPEGRAGGAEVSKPPIQEVLQQHTNELMAVPGVVGVYEGALDDGTPCIKVMVVRRTPELQRKIPGTLAGHPVVIEESGEIRPMQGRPGGG